MMMTYQTLTVAYEGFIFDYTVDMEEAITYEEYRIMSDLVDGWMLTKEAVEKYQQLKYQV